MRVFAPPGRDATQKPPSFFNAPSPTSATLTPVKRHEVMAELIPFARFVVIEGAGHLPPLEQPEAVTQALRDWLTQPLVLR